MADTKKPKRGALDELAEEDVKRSERPAMQAIRRNLSRISRPEDVEEGLRDMAPLKPSAEYVVLANEVAGRPRAGPGTAEDMATLRRESRAAPLNPTGRLSEYDMAKRADGARAVEELDALPRMRQQVVERSGTGAPGQVYAEKDGAAVLMPIRSAEQQRLRVISADEARELGEKSEPQGDFSGLASRLAKRTGGRALPRRR